MERSETETYPRIDINQVHVGLEDEELKMHVTGVTFVGTDMITDSKVLVLGSLLLTNYRLRFWCQTKEDFEKASNIVLPNVDFGHIGKVEKTGIGATSKAWFGGTTTQQRVAGLAVHTRDFRPPLLFEFGSDPAGSSRCLIYDTLHQLCFPQSLLHTFACPLLNNTGTASSACCDRHENDDFRHNIEHFGIVDGPCSCHRVDSLLSSSDRLTLPSTPPPTELDDAEHRMLSGRWALSSPFVAMAQSHATPLVRPSAQRVAAGTLSRTVIDSSVSLGRYVANWFGDERADRTATPPTTTTTTTTTTVVGDDNAVDAEPVVDDAMDTVATTTGETNGVTTAEEACRLFRRDCERCCGWRVSRVNQTGSVCSSYGRLWIVPAGVSDSDVAAAAQFRGRHRGAIVSYRHKASGGVLLRCAQPHVGLGGTRSRADELMIAGARRSAGLGQPQAVDSDPTLHVFDLRGLSAAMGNLAIGGGYETESSYAKIALSFRGVANIHAARVNLAKLRDALHAEADASVVAEASSAWADQLRRLLLASMAATDIVTRRDGAVLVHCSDGWDRTPQVCVLARLLADGETRTIGGFVRLLRSEWLSSGHQSARRLGLCETVGSSREQSPVWTQLVETIWNIMQQHPLAFEFTPKLLAVLLHCSSSLRFGSFFCNNELEREQLRLKASENNRRIRCLWTYLESGHAEKEFGTWRNPLYNPLTPDVIRVDCQASSVRVWFAYHRRFLVPDQQQQQQELVSKWGEIPLGFDSEGCALRRTRQLLAKTDDFEIKD